MAYINGKKVLTAIKTVMAPASLQEKRITPTTFEKEVVADSGYDGLSKVKLNGVLVDTHQTLESTQDGSVAYTKSVPAGALPYASIDTLGGMSYKYNQLVPIISTISDDGITLTSNGDGTYTLNGTATATTFFYFNNIQNIRGHKIFVGFANLNTAVEGLVLLDGNSGAGSTGTKILVNWTYSDNFICDIKVSNGTTLNNFVVIPIFVDLTAMYGAGNEPTTVEQFLSDNPMYNGYVPYTEGDITNANVTSIDSVGVNIWDEEWEVGTIDTSTGLNYESHIKIRSKNYIKVIPNTEYFYIMPNVDNDSFYFYDTNKNFISRQYFNSTSGTITTPSNCEYLRFITQTTTYNNNIAIIKGTSGTYTPYTHNNYPIPSSIQSLEGYGWGVNDSCYNYIDFERKKFVKRVGRVDLGSLTWGKVDTGIYSCSLTKANNEKVLNAKYKYINDYSTMLSTNECLYNGGTNRTVIYIHDNSYTDPTTFKTAMSGVYLYYELATPVITDISNILTDDNFIEVEPYGTLTFENANKKAVPSKIAYLVEVK